MTDRNLQFYNVLKLPFREGQEELINKFIDFATQNDKKYLLFQGATGIGKSLIALTAAKYLSKNVSDFNMFITSSKNILLDQYSRDYDKHISIIKGKSNYPCLLDNHYTYADAPCHANKCLKCKHNSVCPYRQALAAALRDPIVFTNLHFLLLELDYGKRFAKRDLLIIDEAHSVEAVLVDYRTISYTEANIKKIQDIINDIKSNNHPLFKIIYSRLHDDQLVLIDAEILKSVDTDNLKEVEVILIKIQDVISNLLFVITDQLSGVEIDENTDEPTRKAYKTLMRYKSLLDNYNIKIKNYFKNRDEDWICAPYFSKKLNKHTGFELKPLNAKIVASKILNKIADKIIFMSATIGNNELFCKDLGLDLSKAAYVDTVSNFPVENRKIFLKYAGIFNYANKDTFLKSAVKIIDDIIDSYPKNYKGVIHTSNYEQSYYIERNSRHKDRIYTHFSKDKDNVLSSFMTSTSGILCSPSCKEGLDLKGDLCRFQIILKCPWGDLSDKVTKKRLDLEGGREWYTNEVCKNIEQAYGRGVRSETDKCDCYILDESFQRILDHYPHLLSKYFKEAIVKEEG